MTGTTKSQVAVMANDINYIKESLVNNKTEHKEILDALRNLDKRFASKLTEKIVYTLCGVVLLAFVTKLTGMW